MRLVTLCENRIEPSFGLKASHGLSLYIEYKDHKLLYDSGQDNVFIENAEFMGIDLSTCKNIIISHGHLDHAGGLVALEEKVDLKKVIIDNNAFRDRIRINGNKMMDIGISNKLNHFKVLGQEINNSFELMDGVWCISNVKVSDEHCGLEKGLMVRNNQNKLEDDTFDDELNLAFKTNKGLIVISGCSHRGVINIIKHAQKVTGINEIYSFIGGMHLTFASEEDTIATINKLKEFNIKKFIIGHCTGLNAVFLMKQILPKDVEIINNFVGYELNEEELE